MCVVIASGMSTEARSAYRLPLDNLVTWDNDTEQRESGHRASRAEILVTPAMYRTEYTHVDTSWPVNACVRHSDHQVQAVLCHNWTNTLNLLQYK